MVDSILITGGAGFVGSNLSCMLKKAYPQTKVIAFDNLSRRGSELNLRRLQAQGVEFIHGDVRNPDDLHKVTDSEWLIECSAEPSVHAGFGESPRYLIDTNLIGAINCLEYVRTHQSKLLFLSTSRVYPIEQLRSLPLRPEKTRLVLDQENMSQGYSKAGISEQFDLSQSRSLYGSTKLCAEHLIQEYAAMYGITSVINRCGVLAGPWQMGKVDQGFISLWCARHLFGGKLNYMGFGGEGLQVRDILHVADLFELIQLQMMHPDKFKGQALNVGGGHHNSVSLLELTTKVQAISGQKIEIGQIPDTRDADIPYYVSDCQRLHERCDWRPQKSIDDIIQDTMNWLIKYQDTLSAVFS